MTPKDTPINTNAVNIGKLQVSVKNLEDKVGEISKNTTELRNDHRKLHDDFQSFKIFAETQARAARLWAPIVFALLSFLGRIFWNYLTNQDILSML